MPFISLQRTDGTPIAINPAQICYVEVNGQHANVILSNREQIRVVETVDEINALVASVEQAPAVINTLNTPASKRETKG